MNNRDQLKKTIAQTNPELLPALEQQDTNELLKMVILELNKERTLKVDAGVFKGDDGYTPERGKDYFTEEDINFIVARLKEFLPITGVDFLTPAEVESKINIRVETAIGNIPKPKTLKVSDVESLIEDRISSINVPDLKIDTAEEIVEKLNTLKEAIDVSVIKGAIKKSDLDNQDKKVLDGMAKIDGRIKAIDQRWRGGGLSSVSHDSTLSGLGTPASPLSVVGGGSVNVEFNDGNSGGGTVNINWNSGLANNFSYHRITLTGSPTFTFTDPPAGIATVSLRLIQDGTGNRTVTWPSSVKFARAQPVILSKTGGAYDIITMRWNSFNSFYDVVGFQVSLA